MPLYEYRCRACGREFETLRASSAADESATCPAGHDDTVRLLSLVAARPRSGAPAAVPTGGGCCGGGCCGG